MGIGNVCVRGEFEGLFYVDVEVMLKGLNEDDPEEVCYDLYFEELDFVLNLFCEDMLTKSKSWRVVNDKSYLLENELFYIEVEDNEWSQAFKLIQKESYDYSMDGLQSKHYQKYLKDIKESLFNQFSEIGTYAGPWTHGVLKKELNG